VARVISKWERFAHAAARWVREGLVRVTATLVSDDEFPVIQGRDLIAIAGRESASPARFVVMLNKPRGLVTTTRDERAGTPFTDVFEGAACPGSRRWNGLDKAARDFCCSAMIPRGPGADNRSGHRPDKTYHVQINR